MLYEVPNIIPVAAVHMHKIINENIIVRNSDNPDYRIVYRTTLQEGQCHGGR